MALALLVSALATVVLHVASLPAVLHPDLARDLLHARDCVELGLCRTTGPHTTIGGFQGATWQHLLVTCGLMGLDARALQAVVTLAQGLAVGLLFVVSRRLTSQSVALSAAALLLLALGQSPDRTDLWNPSVSPLVNVAALSALVLLIEAPSLPRLVLSAATMGLAVDVHLLATTLVPGALALVVASSERAVRATLRWLAVCVGVWALVSPGALVLNAVTLSEAPVAMAAGVASLGVALGLGARLGRQWNGLTGKHRFVAPVALLCIPWALSVAYVYAVHREFGSRYLHPVLPVLALGLAVLLSCLPARLARLAPVACGVALLAWFMPLLSNPPVPQPFAPVEVMRAEARALAESGVTFDTLAATIDGPGCMQRLQGLAVFMPRSVIDSPPPTSSRVEFSRSRLCLATPGGEPRCAPFVAPDARGGEPFDFGRRVFFWLYDVIADSGQVVELHVPLRESGHEADLAFDVQADPPGWRLARVEQIAGRSSLVLARTFEGEDARQAGRLRPCLTERAK